MKILNLACGENKIPGADNIDLVESAEIRLSILELKSKYENDTVDKVYLFHAIEHIQDKFHEKLLEDIWDILKPGASFVCSYPEFLTIADHFRSNFRGQRPFWKLAIYGRQQHPGDFHVSLMYTPEFRGMLERIGFESIQSNEEPQHEYNTVIKCVKGVKPLNREQIYRKTIFEQ